MLQLGASGDEVKQLQTNLNRILGIHLTVDGQFGAATAAAVKSFQQLNHFTVDGIAGPQTLAAIDAKVKALDATKPQPIPTPAAPEPVQPSHADKVNQATALLQQAMELVKTL